MEISYLFEPIDESVFENKRDYFFPESFGKIIDKHTEDFFPDWENADIVLLGIAEDRACVDSPGSELAPDIIRKHLYQLNRPTDNAKVVDLGNIKKKEEHKNTLMLLSTVLEILVKKGKVAVILGGTQEITYAQYLTYENSDKYINYVSVDSRFDLQEADFGLNNYSYNHQIFLHRPNNLFHFTNLGYQSHFISKQERSNLDQMYFESIRLGNLRRDIRLAEPPMRLADMVSIDMGCVRNSDAPGCNHGSTPGFFAEEICQIARYAGLGMNVSTFSVSEVNPVNDIQERTSQLAAMVIWYFIEGFYGRIEENILRDRSSVLKYNVHMEGMTEDIVFYKSELTGRWWMEVPSVDVFEDLEDNGVLVSCGKEDYEACLNDEIPPRWMLIHSKLSYWNDFH